MTLYVNPVLNASYDEKGSEPQARSDPWGMSISKGCQGLGRLLNEAERAYRQSLRFRSDNPTTYLYLGYALKESGRVVEAVSAFEQVLRLSPGHPAALAELQAVRFKS